MHTLQVLEKKLGYTFRCKEQLQAALYHSSYANEHRCCGVSSNERLEFLGDAVLGLVTADYLYHKHPDLPEGDLTRMRAALVCEESLYEVAQRLGYQDPYYFSRIFRKVVGISPKEYQNSEYFHYQE